VLGKLFYETLLGVKNTHQGVEITGFVCEPAAARPNRNMQYFFLNGRYIKCPTASAALGEAYKHSVMAGKFPACVLYITLPPGLVDVNVHPAKTEVRFADDRPVFSAVYQSAVSAINAQCTRHNAQLPYAQPAAARPAAELSTVNCQLSTLRDPGAEISAPLFEDTPALLTRPKPVTQPPTVPQIVNCQLSIVNCTELFHTYFLAETGGELLLIDKHAAHERIIYERLKAQQGAVQRQVLLEPLPLRLSREESSVLLENKDLLERAGFLIEEFGVDAIVLRECPLLLAGLDLNAQAAEIAGYLLAQKGDLTTGALDWVFHSAACRAAVKAGDPTTAYERERFVEKLLAMPEIRHCPHGRPVMVTITKKEIDKRFGRQ
jgi:DNA mismatch repair protein MutL